MSPPDMDVIKDIPGYKVILKAVLKTQIQQLVEQLASHTDEESVILTASVSDGTLSHLGSDSGKGFLEDNEDVKSQFLGFCLKRHHKKKQAEQAEKERERQQQLLESAQAMPIPTQMGYGPGFRRSPRGPYPRQIMPRPPGMPPGSNIRSPTQRFEPYHVPRLQRNSTSSDPGQLSLPTTPIKQEPSDSVNIESNLTKSPHGPGVDSKDDEKSNSSSSTIPTDQVESASGEKQDDVDPDVSVKLEAISESEMELEITGVEPGRPIIPQNWDPNSAMGLNYDPNSGATGSPGDAQQSYSDELMVPNLYPNLNYKSSQCDICGKIFQSKTKKDRHRLIHTGEKPFQCNICGKSFNQKSNLKSHTVVHMKDKVNLE